MGDIMERLREDMYGSYNVVSWLFNQFVGFMDYLFGIIAYIVRAPFVGWANIIENMINDSLVTIQGVQVKRVSGNQEVDVPEELEKSNTTENKTKPVANDKLTANLSNRINIEDIIYNNVPILDADIFDIYLDKYVDAGKVKKEEAEKSPVVLLRQNIAIWYYSIRNIAIIVMLLVLVYLGIRLSISLVGEKKAQYKELLKAWCIGFAVIFLIHFFMVLVIDINNVLVNTFHKALDGQVQGSESLYDTIRTRAYSFKLSEGLPATIIYMVLIYFLIRFLFIYVKRYFTINILALAGPIIGVKYAYDKIQKGKTSSLSNWMFDFALNVLLQSVHCVLYVIYMTMAFEFSTTSVPGFVLALIMLNFIFKAEDLFLKVFNFDDRSSSIREVKENKNYFAEAYKVTTGITYFSRAIPKYGFGLVKGSVSYLGTTAEVLGQAVTTGVNTISWVARNANTDLGDLVHGKGKPYKHGDFVGTVNKIKDKVGAGITGKLDDALYKVGNMRSLKLGLGRMKLNDPERYKATKQLLIKNKKLKQQVLKRSIGKGVKSVTTMAKLMAGIPMIVVAPGSGFTMLATTVDDLGEMSRGKSYYGHMTKKKIGKRRGRVAKTILFGAPIVAMNYADKEMSQLNKDRKNIRKNEEILSRLRIAEVNKSSILKQCALISAQRQLELKNLPENEQEKAGQKADKALIDAINGAIQSVLDGRNIESAVKEYMIKHSITKLQVSDIEQLLKEFNIGNIEKQIQQLTRKLDEQAEISKLQSKIEELKEKLKDTAEGVTLQEEEKNQIRKELKSTEGKVKLHNDKIDIIRQVGKKASKCQGLEKYMLHRDLLENVVKDYIKTKSEKINESDIDEMVQIFSDQVEKKGNSYTTKDKIEEQFTNAKQASKENGSQDSTDKKLDRKKAVDTILESFRTPAEDGKNKKEKSKTSDEISKEKLFENMYEDVAEMVKDLYILDQQTRVMYGNSQIRANKFIRELKSQKFVSNKKQSKKK